jgi:hypothetical protein
MPGGPFGGLNAIGQVSAPTGIATLDCASIQAAHDALPAAGGAIQLYPGVYALGSGAGLTFTKRTTLAGAGKGNRDASVYGTKLTYTSGTGTAITVSAAGTILRDFALINTGGSVPSAGSGILVTVGDSTQIRNISVHNFFNCIVTTQGTEGSIRDCNIMGAVTNGILQSNATNPDGGDWEISGNYIFAGPNTLASGSCAYLWQSGGGPRIISNKINSAYDLSAHSFQTGLCFTIADGCSTSVALVNDNSIENVTYGVIIQTTGVANTGNFGKVTISANEFQCTAYCVAISPPVYGRITGVVCTGNIGAGTTGFFLVKNVDKVTISNNVAYSGTLSPAYAGTVTNLFMQDSIYTTAARLPVTLMIPGSRYYDLTLNKPIWADSTSANWRDSAGNIA